MAVTRRHLRLLHGDARGGQGRAWLPTVVQPGQSLPMDSTARARLVTTDPDGNPVPFADVIASVAAGDTSPDDWELRIEPLNDNNRTS